MIKIKKILIANRGEIARRIARTCKKMGIPCVGLSGSGDNSSHYANEFDQIHHFESNDLRETFLNIKELIRIATLYQVNAIHPGYGFLAENPQFAKACQKAGIIFIGPRAKTIADMGSKAQAKIIMQKAGVPTLPGYNGEEQDLKYLHKEAKKLGFPLLIKAAAGGGGKGMRIVNSESEFLTLAESAKSEALRSFADDTLILEKYITAPRHIEVQIIGDQHGNYWHLFERHCSVQRRYQKLIEEAPASFLKSKTREQLYEYSLQAARFLDYQSAGTLEFLLDENENIYFMEMNTRLQVEHAVTEMICNLDLVELQIRVANNENLGLKQDDIKPLGHAIEVRICAENPDNNFMPATGLIEYLKLPMKSDNLRIESALNTGLEVNSSFDPMLAKFIAWEKDRNSAITNLSSALADFNLAGVQTNAAFLRDCLNTKLFQTANYDTHFIVKSQIEREQFKLKKATPEILLSAAAIVLAANNLQNNPNPWNALTGFRLASSKSFCYRLMLDGYQKLVEVFSDSKDLYQIRIDQELQEYKVSLSFDSIELKTVKSLWNFAFYFKNDLYYIFDSGRTHQIVLNPPIQNRATNQEDNDLKAPMNSKLIQIFVKVNQKVEQGADLVALEAMKMQFILKANRSGIIKKINFKMEDLVPENSVVIEISED